MSDPAIRNVAVRRHRPSGERKYRPFPADVVASGSNHPMPSFGYRLAVPSLGSIKLNQINARPSRVCAVPGCTLPEGAP